MRPSTVRRRSPYWPVAAVLVVGLLVTGALAWVSARQYNRNERRLLALRARDVGTVLTSALPSIQTPLGSAVALADATAGNPAKFRSFIAPYVGSGSGRPFVSVSLWRTADPARGPLVVAGAEPVLALDPARSISFIHRATHTTNLAVVGLLSGGLPRLGYAFTGTVSGPFAAYAESSIPAGRYQPVPNDSAFSDLDYALYLGRSKRPADLLIASVHRLPLHGRQTDVVVPFGDTSFTVAVVARESLAGSLPQQLPWAIAIIGLLLSAGAAVLTASLIRRRRGVELLAGRLAQSAEENRRLYAEQRGIAQTLQRALLPERLPQLPDLRVGAHYEAGVEGVEIGGDWYDMIELEGSRLLLVVGDVSGRGLRAAATMATLRYAIRAYAAQGDAPEAMLAKLSLLIAVGSGGQLATVLMAMIEPAAHRVSVTSAGHLPPLMISDGRREFLDSDVGLPVGVEAAPRYVSRTVEVPSCATLLAFTDGLVERRGETIDTGLERLRANIAGIGSAPVTLDQLLAEAVTQTRDVTSRDDTAIAGVQWVN